MPLCLLFFFLFSCVYVCIYFAQISAYFICVWAHMFKCMWKWETAVENHPPSLLYLTDWAGTPHQIQSSPQCLALQVSLLCIPLSPPSQAGTLCRTPHTPGIYVGARDSNPSSHADGVSTLTAEPYSVLPWMLLLSNACSTCWIIISW